MSEKRLSVRIAAVGGERLKAILMEIGRDGEQAFRRVERSTDPLNAGFSTTQMQAGRTAEQFEQLADRAARMAHRLRLAGAETESVMSRIDRVTGVTRGARRFAQEFEAYGLALDNLRARFVPAFAEAQRHQQQIEAIDHAHRLGAITIDEWVQATLREEAANTKAAASIRARQAAFDNLIDTTLRSRINEVTGVSAAPARSQEDMDAFARSLDDMRARANPAYDVIRRYRAEVQMLRAAHMAGAFSADELAEAVGRTRRSSLAALAAIRNQGAALHMQARAARVSTFHTQNMMFQFQDIAVMMASGQSPFVLAMQQGMQISAIMEQMRAQGQNAFKTMLGGVRAMLSPMALLTLGTIAAAAAAGQWVISLFQTSEEADKAAGRFETLEQVIDGLGAVSRTSAADIDAYLASAFSNVSAEVQALIDDLRAAEFSLLSRRMRREIESVTGDLNRLGGAFDVFWSSFLDPGSVNPAYLSETRQVIDQAGMAYDDFLRLDAAVRQVFAASTVDEFVARLAEARALAQELGGPVGDSVAEALLRAAEQAGLLDRLLQAANGAADDTAAGTGRIFSGLVDATNQAIRLRDALAAANTASLSRQDQIAILRSQISAAERGTSVAGAAAQAETALELARAGATIDQIAAAAALAGEEAAAIELLQQRLGEMRQSARGAGAVEVEVAEAAAQGWALAAEKIAEYSEQAMDLAGNLGQGFVNAFQSAESALDRFVRTGRVNIRDFVTGIIADFARIGARRFIFGPLAQALGGFVGGGLGGGGLGKMIASVMHEGGMVGRAGRMREVPAAIFAGAPRFHNGGWAGLRPNEVPIIAEKGERILSKEQARYGTGDVHVHFNGVRDAASFRQSRAQIAADLGRAVAQARRGM